MTTSTPETVTTAWVLSDAAGREAINCNSGRRATIVLANPDAFYLREEPGQAAPLDSVVLLPRLGEEVRIDALGSPVEGRWLGVDDISPGPDAVTFHVLVGDRVHTREAPVAETLDARTTVVRAATPETREAMTALAAQISLRQEVTRRHENRMQRLVEDAHEYATDHDLCERFDDFMHDHGLPRRSHDYELRVEINTTIYLTRSGTSLDDAISSVETAEVVDALNLSSSDYEVEEA